MGTVMAQMHYREEAHLAPPPGMQHVEDTSFPMYQAAPTCNPVKQTRVWGKMKTVAQSVVHALLPPPTSEMASSVTAATASSLATTRHRQPPQVEIILRCVKNLDHV
ncbi:unnamed protein product [Staurois parvus]|uniref:Uncharacterized protein n=1 Tax=Staurois parvus TaxID=386267 RepID=A0ABN9G3V7_9NEOB|nr:unnamed protein product [Staurois parvus]